VQKQQLGSHGTLTKLAHWKVPPACEACWPAFMGRAQPRGGLCCLLRVASAWLAASLPGDQARL
jgi:hypothetical protein